MQIDSRIDSKIADYFRKHPPAAFTNLQQFREDIEKLVHILDSSLEKVEKVEDVIFPPMHFRIYQPADKVKGTVLYFHGGGFVAGSILCYDPMCRRLANFSKWSIVSVEYRLAPEYPFPAALTDAEMAFRWLREEGSRYGLDETKIVVAGDSAGGNLAARLTQNHKSSVAGEVLIYPWLDLTLSFSSSDMYGRGFIMERSLLLWFMKQYVLPEMDVKNPDLSPIWEKNLFDLPPTLMIAAEFDPLLDEGKKYADLLLEHGNEVQYELFSHMPHGFSLFGKLIKKTMDEFYEKITNFLGTI